MSLIRCLLLSTSILGVSHSMLLWSFRSTLTMHSMHRPVFPSLTLRIRIRHACRPNACRPNACRPNACRPNACRPNACRPNPASHQRGYSSSTSRKANTRTTHPPHARSTPLSSSPSSCDSELTAVGHYIICLTRRDSTLAVSTISRIIASAHCISREFIWYCEKYARTDILALLKLHRASECNE
ncbi:uncharacterized protein M421DRAFT_154965 [Didymella exigua CBS 183.55]|uniref:Secreted protein n=1 Tax=Didymella exigua CBS 183.55 TaxID=1150837 RepID=A0A6A5RMA2_9PLEO|nr:uncharacterized protein M421DRAFT_154965 [Didymella exigua CBS 183.55]KAF1928779.1 hypothetical protein M421DRAFT_154965 [Didymella exigua CBS 183.55]